MMSKILNKFYILMIQLPPISTLFPYTTLFRSERQLGRPQDPLCEGGEAFLQGPAADDLGAGDDDPPVPDRKSTRLNSSHGYISYAVFCLKKKKTLQMNVT